MKNFYPIRRSAALLPAANPSVAPLLQRKCDCGQHTVAGEECEECKKNKGMMQPHLDKSATSVAAPPIVNEVLSSPGQPMETDTRSFMESRFGHDFSQVRVHQDSKATESATAVNALAYTVGQDVVFGPGPYAPHSRNGGHLLAHELAHVVQQKSGGVSASAESRARASADLVSHGKVVDAKMLGGSPRALQKAGNDAPSGPVAASAAVDASTEPPIDEFGFDKADIPPQHLARLSALQTRLMNAPNATVVLTGHADTVGTEKYNEGLGKRRAMAVRDFLTRNKGVSPSQIQIESRGELEPAAAQPPAKLDPAKGEENAKNRRVEIRATGLPTPSEPKKDWTFDPIDPKKKKPIDLNLPPDYVPGGKPKPGPGPSLPPDFWKPTPPPIKTHQKSVLDVINEKVVDPIVKAVTRGLPKSVQEKILDLAHDGVEKGITSAAKSAAAAAGLDSQGQQAIEKAMEAAIKEKSGRSDSEKEGQ